MLTLLRQLGRFLNNMDARAMTSLGVTIVLLGFVAIMLIFGTEWLGIDQDALNRIMARVSDSPMAIAGVIAVFCALALTGFPQVLLIAGTVAVFGATQGAIYSWIATMCSSTLTFTLGQVFGSSFVKRFSAGRAANMISVVQNHGLLASMLVRVTPSAPFIVVNAVCGAAHIPLWKFMVGTGLGITPKILFLSVFTEQVDNLLNFFKSRDPRDLVVIGTVIVVWLIFLVAVRAIYMRLRRTSLGDLGDR